METTTLNIIQLIAQTIYDKKGANIYAVDVTGSSTMTDSFLIAQGTSDRHVKALAEAVEEVLEKQGLRPLHVEGREEGDWVVLDYEELVIHLMVPDFRERYALEELWPDGKIIELSLIVG